MNSNKLCLHDLILGQALKCFGCADGDDDCLDPMMQWKEVECDAGEVCEYKQYFDNETYALLKASRGCNEQWKCNPGCSRRWNGDIRCERCCWTDLCNNWLSIPFIGKTKLILFFYPINNSFLRASLGV